jgi:hypothetical protein
MKTLFPTLVAVHLVLALGDLAAAEPIDLKSCQTNVQAQIATFKASDDHSHLIKAYRAVFLTPIKPEGTNFVEAVLALRLQVVQECYRARDFDYDVKADHGVTTKVCPPPTAARWWWRG